MKNPVIILTFLTFLLMGCPAPEANLSLEQESIIENGIRWEGGDMVANHMAMIGLNRYITYENNHAFIMSEAAVGKDSSLFASHALLALLAEGERKEYHKKMANKFVEGENETSKLFVSLLNFDDLNDSTREERRKIWTKMHELSNGPFIHYMYTRYMDGDGAAKIKELDQLIAFCEKNNFNYTGTAANNYKGYLLKHAGDLEAGTVAIQKCVELHPRGYNPYDSRAEFFLYAGDTINSIKWYKKVLEQYPYAQYAKSQLEKLEQN